MTSQSSKPSLLRLALAITVASVGVFSTSACSQDDAECKAKFVKMLEPCVPQCQDKDPAGVGTDDCIRTCVQDEWDEPIPQC